MKKLLLISLILLNAITTMAQMRRTIGNRDGYNSGQYGEGRVGEISNGRISPDSLGGGNKKIPKGIKVWNVDKKFGYIISQPVDTVTHLFPNTVFTSGKYGEYNTTGNLSAPRINRIFADRPSDVSEMFIFTQPYDFFLLKPEQLLFTNTLSPLTNITYNNCGNRMNGEDSFSAKYCVNAGKNLGFGFITKYLYGRGYYSDQSTSMFNFTLFGSYLGERYQAHLILSSDAQKVSENGGITSDTYITHPEIYSDSYTTSEIPTMLRRNWNRNSGKHAFFTHRYSIGFNRKVPMTEDEIAAKKFAMESKKENEKNKNKDADEHLEGRNEKETVKPTGRPEDAVVAGDEPIIDKKMDEERIQVNNQAVADSLNALAESKKDTAWLKNEYVPVTSFIHTAQLDSYRRIYQAYYAPTDYYVNDFMPATNDSIFDETKHLRLRNTIAISMLEGFNKWMLAGIKLFATSDLQRFALPDAEKRLSYYKNHDLSIGGQLSKTQGKTLHYQATAETWMLGDNFGQLSIDGNIDLNLPILGDTMTLKAGAFFHNSKPAYYMRHYHGRHYWWDKDLSNTTHSRIEGTLSSKKTRTSLHVSVDAITNYTYLSNTYEADVNKGRLKNNTEVKQYGDPLSVITASLKQDFTLGPLNWETILTYQKSTKQEVLPVPDINAYTNLYLKFRIARVLYTELGADARFFTSYTAPDYVPGIGQFAVQGNAKKVEIGNYPIVNAYANFNLKGTRFFIMYTHLNSGSGNKMSFLSPYYPINGSILRMGLSWNFYN